MRIIGGEWRRRIIQFDTAAGVRPTPDRVRQTLFDWLAPLIEGAHCLDLFAGSGALGLEALSRGAARVTFVEAAAKPAALIRAALEKLGAAARAEVLQADALRYLDQIHTPAFDAVFLDPPFDAGLLKPALERLPPLLRPDNCIYLEYREGQSFTLPSGYTLLREKKAGQVSYALATFSGASA
ncbi:MAG: 16S rRNA (guanine(966)-N(2))-methyltransferase RsmD [Hydrocarboniphaga effusa]|nr:16S rRNA (guanine(966)-N(2))-methyltransferase RsmD [Hydrocarboniphaga effusa]